MAIDYEHYLKLSFWSPFEGLALLLGIEPGEYEKGIKVSIDYLTRDPFTLDFKFTGDRTRDKELSIDYLHRQKIKRQQHKHIFKLTQSLLKSIDLWNRDVEVGVIEPDHTNDKGNFYHPAKFINWAIAKGFDVPDELKGDKPQAEAVGDDEANQGKRKKLIPMKRERNEALLLLYEIFKFYKVLYLDDLPAAKAWGKIVSMEFTSDLIKQVTGTRNTATIELNRGDKVDFKEFSRIYTRRFKNPTTNEPA
jgi:hypothetical protein